MKLQDVILKALAKKLTWTEAAEIASMSVRNMQRKRQAYQDHGYNGLFDQRRGKRSYHRVPLETVEQVLALYQQKYFDFNVCHFHEKLREQEGIQLSYSWVKQALQGAGLVARKRKRGTHRRRRPRRPLPGMLLHIDGSTHRWFQDDRYYDLIVILDDATSEIYYAQLVEEESTRTVMAALKEVIEKQGLFCALYSDRGSHFFVTRKAGEAVDKNAADASGPGAQRAGDTDDPRLLAASPRTDGAQLQHLAEPPAPGITAGRDLDRRGRQSFLARALYCRVQPQFPGESGATRHGLPPMRTTRSGLGVHDSDRACGGAGQYGRDQGALVADREMPLALHAGGPDGDDSRASEWRDLDSLWPARRGSLHRVRPGGPWKRRSRGRRGKPTPGFPPRPPLLGKLAKAASFPLSHRPDDSSSFSKAKPKAKRIA